MALLPILMAEGVRRQTRARPIYLTTATVREVCQTRIEAASAHDVGESELFDE